MLALSLVASVLLPSGPLTAPAAEASQPAKPETAQPSNGSAEQPPATEHQRAAARAAKSGKPVRVESLTTSTDEVLALPGGSFERRSHVEPVRTKKNGRWHDIDTTLTAHSDGSVAPRMASVDLKFSGGGSELPLAQVGYDGVEVSLGWDAEFWGKGLPKPELDGNTARYRDVLAGVDLEIQATATGFRQVLVVKNAEAARNPKLKTVRFGHEVRGGQVEKKQRSRQKAKAGKPAPSTLEVVDDQGDVVFVGNASKMWDSSGKVADEHREATVAEDDDRTAVMDVEVDGDHVEIAPDQEFLTDSSTEYPVYIDPNYICTTCDGRDDYLVVYQKGGEVGDTAWNNDDENLLKAGHVHDVNARSYFDFDISDVPSSATINSATLQLTVNNSYYPDCRGTTSVYFTSYINSSMSWGNEPTKGWGVDGDGYVGVINGSNKPSNTTECTGNWQRTSSVTPGVQDLREASRGQATFGLYASTYSSSTDWRRFRTNPGLTIRYSLKPLAPAGRTAVNDTSNLGCASALGVDWISKSVTTELKAKVSNPSIPSGASYDNSSGWVRAMFAIKRNGESGWTYRTTSYQSSGGTHRTVLSSTFQLEGYFEWRVRSEDTNGNVSPWVGSAVDKSCYVGVDRVSPDTPRVSPVADPSGDNSYVVGKTSSFKLSPGTLTGKPSPMDIAYYKWSMVLEDDPVPDTFKNTVTAGSDGTATIRLTPFKDGPNVLYVKAYDKAGNTSLRVNRPVEGKSDYHEVHIFTVLSGGGPVANWEFEDNGIDSVGQRSMTLTGTGANYGDGYAKRGLELPGTSGVYGSAAGRVLDTSSAKSFTVAAWARLDSKTGNSVVTSQNGAQTSRFKLIYLAADDRWSFNLHGSDVASPVATNVKSVSAPELNKWTHLAGAYDAGTGKAKLYVNGKPQGELAFSGTPWPADATFTVGASKWNNAMGGVFKGGIDEVRAYSRVLFNDEIADLANIPLQRSWHKLDEDAGTVADDSVGNHDGTAVGLTDSTAYNVVGNPGLESWTNGVPDCFQVNGWGENSHALAQVPGRTGQGAELTISAHTDGKRHLGTAWAECAPTVTPGKAYDVSLWYQSNTDEVAVDVFIQGADGTWNWWTTVDELWTTSDWTKASATTPPVPDGVQRIAVALTVSGVGAASVDDFRTSVSAWAVPGTVLWDPTGPGAVFSGTSGSEWTNQDMAEIAAPLPATVSSARSFSVAAYVRHGGFDAPARQAVSLSGSRYMPVGLGYRPEHEGRWTATLVTGSQTAPVAHHMVSDLPVADTPMPDPDGWVHLALTYDAVRSEVRFYVNGVVQSTVRTDDNWTLGPLADSKLVLPAPFAADARKLIIGRGTWVWPDGYKADPWKGAVRDVRVASGVACVPMIDAWREGGLGDGGCDGGEETWPSASN